MSREFYNFRCDSILTDYAKAKVRSDEMCLIAVLGRVGRGKSFTALRIGHDCDENFNIDYLAMSPVEFQHIIHNVKPPKYSTIIFDEAGVAANNRRWYSQINKALVSSFEVMRIRNYVVILTLPVLKHLDSQIRNFIDVEVKVQEKTRLDGLMVTKGSWKFNEVNESSGKTYLKWKKLKSDIGFGVVNGAYWYHPPMKLGNQYKLKSIPLKEKMLADSMSEIKAEGDFTHLNDHQREVFDDYTAKKMTQTEIAAKHNISQPRVAQILKKVKSEGYKIE